LKSKLSIVSSNIQCYLLHNPPYSPSIDPSTVVLKYPSVFYIQKCKHKKNNTYIYTLNDFDNVVMQDLETR